MCGTHTASDPTRRSGNMTHWFITCAIILLYAHRTRRDLRGAYTTLSVYRGHYKDGSAVLNHNEVGLPFVNDVVVVSPRHNMPLVRSLVYLLLRSELQVVPV